MAYITDKGYADARLYSSSGAEYTIGNRHRMGSPIHYYRHILSSTLPLHARFIRTNDDFVTRAVLIGGPWARAGCAYFLHVQAYRGQLDQSKRGGN